MRPIEHEASEPASHILQGTLAIPSGMVLISLFMQMFQFDEQDTETQSATTVK